jgi:glycosyltransferase involved in cell wall biosynthesis
LLHAEQVRRPIAASVIAAMPVPRRPLIAFFSEVAPHPRPLYGGQIRVERLIRALLEEYDVAFACQTTVGEAELRENWDLAPRLTRIITAPAPDLSPALDPFWGPLGLCGQAALRCLIPRARPASHGALWSEELIAKARDLMRELPVQVVWASRTWMAEMARAAGARTILADVGDFEGTLMLERLARERFYRRKPLHLLQGVQLKRYERLLPRRFEAVSAVKHEDLPLVAGDGRSRVHVVPNGIDIPAAVVRKPRSHSLLFVGALWYEPNEEALHEFVVDVLPAIRSALPDVTLTVAGRGPVSRHLEGVLAQSAVELLVSPPSLTALYEHAALCVAPLKIGGGTSMKVLEALAHGVPTVASPVAARGLGLQHDKHIVIANSSSEFAQACVELLENPGRAETLGETGRDEVRRRFSWDTVGAVARDVVRALCAP